MAKEVKYLKQVVPHLEQKIGAGKAPAIMAKAHARYAELVAENENEPKEYHMHTRQRIYPGIAMFDAMTGAGIDRAEAADFLVAYSGWRAKKMAPLVKAVLKIPGLYRAVPKFFFNMTQKNFGPHMGFASENQYVAKDEMRFDMTQCPYQDKCVHYGCPEIVKGYCNGDDILYGNMHPKVCWERTKTLGHGDDVCDFKIRIKEKQEQ